jgi:Complex I intermediate-associated protein 30 (CIA30)
MDEGDVMKHLHKSMLLVSGLIVAEGYGFASNFSMPTPESLPNYFAGGNVFEPITDAVRGGNSEIICNAGRTDSLLVTMNGLLSYINGATGPVGFAKCQTEDWLSWSHFQDRFEAMVSSPNTDLVFELILTTKTSAAEGFEYRHLFRATPQDSSLSARWDRDFVAVRRGQVLENKPYPFSAGWEDFKVGFQVTRGSQDEGIRRQTSKIPFSLTVKGN